jgi:pimeloyl-ACP methyl ester carboxylesterase
MATAPRSRISKVTSAMAKPLNAKAAPPKASTHLRASDLHGIAQLATQATLGVAGIAESVHQSVRGTLGIGKIAQGQTNGIPGLVYRGVRGITQLVGRGIHTALGALEPWLQTDAASSPQREAVLAALNGVLGDQLAAQANPLATRMQLRWNGHVLAWPAQLKAAPSAAPRTVSKTALKTPPKTARKPSNRPDQGLALPKDAKLSGKLLILVHGLCMNDLQWSSGNTDHSKTGADTSSPKGTAKNHGTGHASALATLGYTPLYLRYNTGLHTSQNGHLFAAELEQLIAHWPVKVDSITLLVHSMGGLVSRSALHSAQQQKMQWPAKLKNIVFLGTPHHGAPLEKAGNWVDIVLGSTPYSKPFAKLGQLRSAGITDLRYGHTLDVDWVGKDRFRRQPDSRQHLPLPQGVACYTIAGTTASQRSPLAERLVGDGLVPLPSALGQHRQAARNLQFAANAQTIAYRTNHMQLLHSPAVTAQLLKWLG